MNALDLAVDWPALVTPAMELSAGADEAPRFGGGVVAHYALATLPRATFGGQAGVRVWSAAVDLGDEKVHGTVADIELEVGERWGPGWSRHSEGKRGVFWELGLGPHVVLFGGDAWGLHVNPALGAHTGLGGVVGDGKVRAMLELRASATFRADEYWGTTARAGGDVSWAYYPGRVGIELLGGIELR